MDKLLEIKDPALLESGIFPSLPPNQDALWKNSVNVSFLNGAAEKVHGVDILSSAPQPIIGLGQTVVGGEPQAYLAAATAFYKWSASGGLVTLRSGFTGERWSIIPWGDWILATNDTEQVQVSKNTTLMTDLGNVPVMHAKIVRKLAQRPIIFYGQEFAWPRATDIEYWTTPDPTGNAGSLFIRDLDSDVQAVEPLGEQLAFYTENKMGFISFIGGNSVYGAKVKLEGIGAVGIGAVIAVGARHYGMSRNGLWVTDGSSWDYIDQPAVYTALESAIDKEKLASVVGVHVQDKAMVRWFFDCLDGQRRGIGYNYKARSWHFLKVNATAIAAQETFDNPLMALGVDFGLYDTGNDFGSTVMETSLITMPFHAGDVGHYKFWQMVEVYFVSDGTGQPEVRFWLHQREIYGADSRDRQLSWAPLEAINWIENGGAESVYITMEVRSLAADTHYRIGGLSVHGSTAGAVNG